MIKKPHKMIRKCAICGKPTYHHVCAECKAKADADEKNRRNPYRPHVPYRKYSMPNNKYVCI